MRNNFDIQTILNSPCGNLNQHLVVKPEKKVRKYRNKKCERDGIKFDSKKEADRYTTLKILQKKGEIGLLELQKPFLLIEANEIERKCEYIADFVYWDIKTGKQIIEDVKSDFTRKLPVYIMKRKLLLERYGIKISEV